MGVRYYQFGKQVGGSDSSGNSIIPAEAPYGAGDIYAASLPAGNTTITFTSETKSVTLRNTHDSQSLDYSLDGGTTWQTLESYDEIQEPITVGSVVLRNSGAANTTYEVVGILT